VIHTRVALDPSKQDTYELWLKTRDGSRKIWPVSELAPLRTGQSRPEQRVIVIHTRVALDPSKQDTYGLWLKTRDGSRKIWPVVEAPNADGQTGFGRR